MGLNWKFQRGGGFKPNHLLWEGYGYFLEQQMLFFTQCSKYSRQLNYDSLSRIPQTEQPCVKEMIITIPSIQPHGLSTSNLGICLLTTSFRVPKRGWLSGDMGAQKFLLWNLDPHRFAAQSPNIIL